MMRARVGRPFVQGRPADVGAGMGADGACRWDGGSDGQRHRFPLEWCESTGRKHAKGDQLYEVKG